jgi:predicted tellurium resistance membrane protein TerC
MPHWITDPQIWASFFTLSVLEIVLGIDNIIFLSIVSGQLPEREQPFARAVGLSIALVLRIMLLATISWLSHMSKPVFYIAGNGFSWREIALGLGGLFLLYKATVEIHNEMEGGEEETHSHDGAAQIVKVIAQIVFIDLILALDSIFTAVGVAERLSVMIAAIVVAIVIMLLASNAVAKFVNEHPTLKMLALGFLLVVGVVLIADALGFHIPRGYLYCAIGFSLVFEMLNQMAAKARAKRGRRTVDDERDAV